MIDLILKEPDPERWFSTFVSTSKTALCKGACLVGEQARSSFLDSTTLISTEERFIMAGNLSVWLLPSVQSQEYTDLANIITGLAEKHSNHPYAPHVTLAMLPASFPPSIVERVLREMQSRLYQQSVVFDNINTNWVGIAVHGRKYARPLAGQPVHEKSTLLWLQEEFHHRLNEELTAAIQRGDPEVMDLGYTRVNNIVGSFPHFSLAYTEVGQKEGVQELEETGVLVRYGEDLHDLQKGSDDLIGQGLTLAGHRGFKVGAMYAAYCGGFKPEKWRVFLRIN
ncbi:hypothetical protein PIIN_00203 [Serendipita indica DSM 11827]|uniref:2',3'-cyclic-nucleotide 3'-phosphodiesterase n=1 Tax=Serendipita indica (strain DSM 11827) TaxID=1109443 RepID=G4T585_SERID|nr:hypothetical protein PIIN_00203 [Serendipita indica DSM 11827]